MSNETIQAIGNEVRECIFASAFAYLTVVLVRRIIVAMWGDDR